MKTNTKLIIVTALIVFFMIGLLSYETIISGNFDVYIPVEE